MKSFVVNTRFSKTEVEEIDGMIETGVGKSRSDLIRIATIHYMYEKKEQMEGTK